MYCSGRLAGQGAGCWAAKGARRAEHLGGAVGSRERAGLGLGIGRQPGGHLEAGAALVRIGRRDRDVLFDAGRVGLAAGEGDRDAARSAVQRAGVAGGAIGFARNAGIARIGAELISINQDRESAENNRSLSPEDFFDCIP